MTAATPAPLELGNALPGARPQHPDAGVHRQATALAASGTARHTLHSSDLLAGATTVEIEHLGQTYRLQTTRAGKLILTK